MGELRRTKTYIHDIERCISFIENIDRLKNKSIFVTGCNGLICSTVTDSLILLNNRYDLGITVYSASRNTERTMAIFDTDANKFIKIIGYDACKPMSFGEHVEKKTNTFIQNVWKGNKKKRGVFKQGRGICPMRPHLTGAYA